MTNSTSLIFSAEKMFDLLLDQPWHKHCELLREKDGRLVVRYNSGSKYPPHLRYSAGPKQGFFWDIYGDEMQSFELAVIALSQAPAPVDVGPITFTFKLDGQHVVNEGKQ